MNIFACHSWRTVWAQIFVGTSYMAQGRFKVIGIKKSCLERILIFQNPQKNDILASIKS